MCGSVCQHARRTTAIQRENEVHILLKPEPIQRSEWASVAMCIYYCDQCTDYRVYTVHNAGSLIYFFILRFYAREMVYTWMEPSGYMYRCFADKCMHFECLLMRDMNLCLSMHNIVNANHIAFNNIVAEAPPTTMGAAATIRCVCAWCDCNTIFSAIFAIRRAAKKSKTIFSCFAFVVLSLKVFFIRCALCIRETQVPHHVFFFFVWLSLFAMVDCFRLERPMLLFNFVCICGGSESL